MLQGIVINPVAVHADERGFFSEIYKSTWKELFKEEIAQANLSITYPSVVRAWHRHERGQVDYFTTFRGAVKICAYDEKEGELDELISTASTPQIIRIPGKYWHGFKVIGHKPVYLLYFTNRAYDHKNPDEVRRPWNDPAVIPQKINGSLDDPRCGKSWDWYASPNK